MPAWPENGRTSFAAGVEASRAGHNERALEYFLTAWRRGMDSTALYFNLGVTYYHLGRLDEAETAFKRITGSPKAAALAFYNLGLIANDRGHTQQAAEWFRRAERAAQTDKLRELSRLAASRLPSPRPSSPRAGLWIELGGGYDDNALLIPDDSSAVSGRSDALASLAAYGYTWLAGRTGDGLKMEGYIQTERYDELSEFDLDFYQAGPAYQLTAGAWEHSVAASWRRIRIDGANFQDSRLLQISSSRFLSENWEMGLGMEYESVDAEPAFSYLEGDREALRFQIRRHRRHKWRVRYYYEQNEREDLTYANGDFRSFSPASHALSVQYKISPAGPLEWSAGLEYKQSRYADPEIYAGGIAERREDERRMLSLGLGYLLSGGWRIGLELVHYDNDSNFSEFRYQRGVATLSIDTSFDTGR